MKCSTSLLLAGFLIATGCSESAVIRTNPEGAQAFVNDKLIGSTPTVLTVERSELADSYTLRVEKEGFVPYVGDIKTRVAGGRATAAVFTLGIVYLFKSPWYLALPGVIPLQPSLEAEADRRLGKELRELNQLLEDKQITAEEFAARRIILLEGR